MSEATVISNVKKATLNLKISNISQLEDIWSPDVTVQGVPWYVIVRKVVRDANHSLGIYLHSAKKEETPNWSHAASLVIRFLPFDPEQNVTDHHFGPFVFDQRLHGFGTHSLIQWTDLFDAGRKLVEDDAINMEIEIEAEDPDKENRSKLIFERTDRCCDEGCLATFKLTVINVQSLMAVQSPQFTLRHIPWNLTVFKDHSSDLNILLKSEHVTEKISCKMAMSMKLISSKTGVESVQKTKIERMRCNDFLYSGRLISWEELLKLQNGYVNNNSITLEVEIGATKPDGVSQNDIDGSAAKPLQLECAVCLENIMSKDLSSTPCGHLFCTACITKAVEDHGACPMCSAAVDLNVLRRLYLPIKN